MSRRKKVVSRPPVVGFGSLSFEESRYVRGGKTWLASTLYRACLDQELEPFEFPLACYDLSNRYFALENTDDFVWQMRRTLDADYERYPVILDEFGQVCDGNHRICHALLDGRESVMAYRLQSMPKPDFVDEGDNNGTNNK